MRQSEKSRDYYTLLDVAKDATADTITHMYRTKARRLHPDLGGNCEEMKLLNEAYEVLKDPLSRRAYDVSRATQYPDNAILFASSSRAPRRRWVHTLDKRCLGLIMAGGAGLYLGLFLMSELGDRRVLYVRVLSAGLMGVGVLLLHSALRFGQHELRQDIGRPRKSIVTYEGLILAIGFAALILLVTLQYVR